MANASQKVPTKTATHPPIVLDLGKKSRKAIRRLKKGKGKLYDDVNLAIDELRREGHVPGDAQPIIVHVVERQKRFQGLPLPF